MGSLCNPSTQSSSIVHKGVLRIGIPCLGIIVYILIRAVVSRAVDR